MPFLQLYRCPLDDRLSSSLYLPRLHCLCPVFLGFPFAFALALSLAFCSSVFLFSRFFSCFFSLRFSSLVEAASFEGSGGAGATTDAWAWQGSAGSRPAVGSILRAGGAPEQKEKSDNEEDDCCDVVEATTWPNGKASGVVEMDAPAAALAVSAGSVKIRVEGCDAILDFDVSGVAGDDKHPAGVRNVNSFNGRRSWPPRLLATEGLAFASGSFTATGLAASSS